MEATARTTPGVQELQQQLQDQRGEAADPPGELQELQQRVERLEQRQKQTEAHLWNVRAASYNARCVSVSPEPEPEPPFRPFKKANAGLGTPLPNAPLPRQELPELEIGDVIPTGFFPENLSALMGWSHQQINALCILANDDFGIVTSDRVLQRQLKVERFVTGYHIRVDY